MNVQCQDCPPRLGTVSKKVEEHKDKSRKMMRLGGEERQETDSHQPSGKKMRQTDIRENIPKRKDEEQKEIENETPGEHDDHQHETPHNKYSTQPQ